MNKVELNPNYLPKEGFKIGDLFLYEGKTYILCKTNLDEYQALCLEKGKYWKEPANNINDAIRGLKFYGRDCEIIIKRRNQNKDSDESKYIKGTG